MANATERRRQLRDEVVSAALRVTAAWTVGAAMLLVALG